MDTNQIEVYDKINDMSAITELGRAISLSGMFGCKRIEQGTIFALQCIAERKPPLEMAKTYHVINDKLAKRADAMLADFRRAGGKWAWGDLNDEAKQTARVEWEGQLHEVSYTIEQAKQAGLIKEGSAWAKDPAPMLRARLTSRTLRAIAPELVMGVYTTEELTDSQPVAVGTEDVNVISPERVAQSLAVTQVRVEQSKPAPTPTPSKDDPFANAVEADATDVIDPNIVPIGKNKGKQWMDLGRSTLEVVIANPGPLTSEQLSAAKDALERTPF